jgi:hypothetical protein
MSLRIWAIKIGELKPLSRGGLLFLSVRCAMRVEPWLPKGVTTLWREGLEYVATAAFDRPTNSDVARDLARELSDRGAAACNRLQVTDEPLGQCMNYTTLTLATAVEAASLDAGPALKKAVIDSAKLSASIPAVLAHAKRIIAPPGQDPVEVACLAIWNAIRADIPSVAVATSELETAKDRIGSLRRCAPLWVGRTPTWASGLTA